MDINDVIHKLIQGIKENSPTIQYEEQLSKDLQKACQIKDFYDLPNLTIGKIIRESYYLTKEIAALILNKYSTINPDGAPLLLNYISIPAATFDDCCNIISSLTSSPICRQLREQNDGVEVDWSYELKQRDDVISDLKERLKYEDLKLPSEYEPNIFKACKENNFDSVQYMVYKHSDIEVKDKDGNTPLIVAIANDNYGIAHLLIENGANIENPDMRGNTPLMVASAAGHVKMVKLLVSKGANVNASSDSGNTALQYASVMNETAIVKFLLKNGANKNIKDSMGKTAKDWSRSHEMLNILL